MGRRVVDFDGIRKPTISYDSGISQKSEHVAEAESDEHGRKTKQQREECDRSNPDGLGETIESGAECRKQKARHRNEKQERCEAELNERASITSSGHGCTSGYAIQVYSPKAARY
jgi:hypothetical protein